MSPLTPASDAWLQWTSFPGPVHGAMSRQRPNSDVIARIERIGYLAPQEFVGAVHSVFAQACNVAWRDSLLTLVRPALADGPTVFVLGADAPADLRAVFGRGEAICARDGCIESRRARLDVSRATVWRAPAARRALPDADIGTRLARTRARLAGCRSDRPSVVVREAQPTVARLEAACGALDAERACAHAARLIGWGEGLTPAGDDFLVGLCAALRALAAGAPERADFVARVSECIAASCGRTTPIAVHHLRLAARGHFNADVLRAVDALRAEDDPDRADVAIGETLAAGATSGADTLTGVLAGFAAWMASPRG
jgi:hypothetical protein